MQSCLKKFIRITESESTSERPKRPREESMENILTSKEPRRSTRQRKFVSFGPDFVALLLENEPQTFKAAMSSSESTYWKEAVIVRLNQF